MSTVRRTYALIVLFLLTACGTTSQFVRVPNQSRVVDDQGKGRIYVIGQPFAINIPSRNVKMRVTDDGERIGSIVGRGYLCWERAPGIAMIASEPASSPYGSVITLPVERGKAHYVFAHIGPKWSVWVFLVPGGGDLAVRLEVVTEDRGKAALARSNPPEQK
ncbi:MAG: hypothetical protein H6Q87_1153 [candidate division NC10 bacterium]|jgi:hypothetical protein|nr:hypothetical protein [candidate division NC10 bacterium]